MKFADFCEIVYGGESVPKIKVVKKDKFVSTTDSAKNYLFSVSVFYDSYDLGEILSENYLNAQIVEIYAVNADEFVVVIN